MAPLIDERARVHLAAPEIAGEAVQDAVRVIRDPVDAVLRSSAGTGAGAAASARGGWSTTSIGGARRRKEEAAT